MGASVTPAGRWLAWAALTGLTFTALEADALRRRDLPSTLTHCLRAALGLQPRRPRYLLRVTAFNPARAPGGLMRHLTAVHRDPTDARPGGWHYASLGKRGGGPIGFCPQHDPHTTEREARACYAAYERSLVRLDVMYGNWQGCAICDSPTKSGAGSGGYRDAPLCGDHRDLSTVYHALHLDEPAGDSWGS